MSTEITLPKNKIAPKPTRNEIVAALVEIARGNFDEEQKAHKADRAANLAAFEKIALKRFKAEWKTAEPAVGFGSYGTVRISFQLPADDITKRMDAIEDHHRYFTSKQTFNEKATRAMIRENITGQTGTSHEERVAAILGDKETAKYLEEVYAGIISPGAPDEAAALEA